MSNTEEVDLYTADVETLLKFAGQRSVWRERWENGDGLDAVDLQLWFNTQRESTPDEMFYKEASASQIIFVRDEIRSLFLQNIPYNERPNAMVVGWHRSKSVTLPVYRLENPKLGVRIYLRDNFYNWKLSVDSIRPVRADFTGLFKMNPPEDKSYSGDSLAPCYFEGFKNSIIFGYYGPSDGRRWSAEIHGRHALWATLFLMLRSFGAVHDRNPSRRDQHIRELKAETARELLRKNHPGVPLPPFIVND